MTTSRLRRTTLLLACVLTPPGCAAPSGGAGEPGATDGAPEVAAAPPPPGPVGRASGEAGGPDTLPPYMTAGGLAGEITSVGAATTTNLVTRVSTEFRRVYPGVTFRATAGLTSIGPAALLGGRADLVPMSRALTAAEVAQFRRKYGYPPTEIKVAADALAVYVERRNPVAGLTLTQLDGIFSRTQRRGGDLIDTWGGAGLAGEWAARPIALYGYGPGDGVHQTFREQVLEGGEFRLSLRYEPAGSSIVQGVASDPSAVGCASVFFACRRVRAVPLAGPDGQFYAPTPENVAARRYPLRRFLYVCVNKRPGRPLDRPAAEFLRFLLSREGQQIVAADGNIPLDAATAAQGRLALAD